ncbi:MAG TPA: MFS transporter [Caulobacteraceae bacterium]|nr:MFS transporter [Caulobacteraceae bacterium]
MARDATRPSLPVSLAYAGYALPMGLMIPPLSLVLPAFYAQTMGVSLAAVGAIVGALRIYDLVFNPILGVMSDRTVTRIGRRRPWMLAGAPLLALGLWLVFTPPVAHASAAYLTVALLIYYTGSSLVMIPYYALGAETPATAFGRARLLGMREAAGMLALSFSGIIPLLAHAAGFPAASRQTMLFFFVALAVLTPVTLAALLVFVPDRPIRTAAPERFDLVEVFGDFWGALVTNRPFGQLALAYAIINFAIFTDQSVTLFYLGKVLMIEKMFGLALLAQGLCTVLAAPVWVVLARRIELHRLIGFSVLVSALFRVTAYSLLQPGHPMAFIAIQAVGAVLFSGTLILASAIMATAIDYGVLKTGKERAGTYISANSIISQLAGALPFAMVLPLLQWAGFKAAGVSSAQGLHALRFVYVYAPLPFQLLGAWLIWRFPISRQLAAEQADQLVLQRNAEVEMGALPV